MSDVLFSLKEASSQLGVHPVTLRRWAEGGKIETVRTPGGHRRFSESEINRLKMQTEAPQSETIGEQLRDSALTSTRADLATHSAGWIDSIAQEDKEEKRLLGRRLMGLLMQYVASEDGDSEEIMDEGRVTARIYAKSIVMSGISLQDALRATNFFRDHILESAVVLPDTARRRPEANQKMFRKLNEFLNEVQLVIANCYEAMGAVGYEED
ncbi:MAG: excisionase family DNA-binding protein [Bacteroidetes Order II. Incertae sedis bacterium]|jgi:excisionase family DNA binding protein|nr:excisionase family DNA-binding protein [Bacteroidetes Order II. bacterium]MBT6200099.1 excisionase family DNA-binding protein [Bacteroidetes Order II. bacterium]MBT6423875.1 excisionase family DNA-binding protein [Bacteroidetes Order II. bacterium]MBT6599005.1 excisionase family DNA-binding protein [Bacteroidetes Order II. bacterium]